MDSCESRGKQNSRISKANENFAFSFLDPPSIRTSRICPPVLIRYIYLTILYFNFSYKIYYNTYTKKLDFETRRASWVSFIFFISTIDEDFAIDLPC